MHLKQTYGFNTCDLLFGSVVFSEALSFIDKALNDKINDKASLDEFHESLTRVPPNAKAILGLMASVDDTVTVPMFPWYEVKITRARLVEAREYLIKVNGIIDGLLDGKPMPALTEQHGLLKHALVRSWQAAFKLSPFCSEHPVLGDDSD